MSIDGLISKIILMVSSDGDVGDTMVVVTLKEGFPKKNCCSFGFCPNEGGRALPKLFGIVS